MHRFVPVSEMRSSLLNKAPLQWDLFPSLAKFGALYAVLEGLQTRTWWKLAFFGVLSKNWAKPDRFWNMPSRLIMRMMGFVGPHQLGAGWLKFYKPDKAEVRGLLDLDFANVIPAHGEPVIGDAVEKYRPAVEKYAG